MISLVNILNEIRVTRSPIKLKIGQEYYINNSGQPKSERWIYQGYLENPFYIDGDYKDSKFVHTFGKKYTEDHRYYRDEILRDYIKKGIITPISEISEIKTTKAPLQLGKDREYHIDLKHFDHSKTDIWLYRGYMKNMSYDSYYHPEHLKFVHYFVKKNTKDITAFSDDKLRMYIKNGIITPAPNS